MILLLRGGDELSFRRRLQALKDEAEHLKTIVLTAQGSVETAVEAVKNGAEDYLTKDHTLPELLPRILERVRRNRALRTTLEENLEMVRVTVSHLVAAGKRVFLDAEHFFDGWHLDRGYALAVVRAAHEAGAEVVVLCDGPVFSSNPAPRAARRA